jgi:arylsulfatase A-like enzyme
VKLTEHGLLDNTLIVVTSDTGARLKMTKPDSPIDGDAVGWDVSTLDIAPSLLQLAGGNLPERALRQIE